MPHDGKCVEMTRVDWWIGVMLISASVLVHAFAVRERPGGNSPSEPRAWILWSGFKSAPKDAWLWDIDDAFPTYSQCTERAKQQLMKRRGSTPTTKVTDDSAGLGFEEWPQGAPWPSRWIWRCLPDTIRLPMPTL